MVQPTGDRRQVLEPHGHMTGTFLEDRPPLVLGKGPPLGVLADGDQRALRRNGPAQCGLLGDEAVLLRAGDVPLVAGDSAEDPAAGLGHHADRAGDDVDPLDGREGLAGDGLRRDDRPSAGPAADEGEQPGAGGAGRHRGGGVGRTDQAHRGGRACPRRDGSRQEAAAGGVIGTVGQVGRRGFTVVGHERSPERRPGAADLLFRASSDGAGVDVGALPRSRRGRVYPTAGAFHQRSDKARATAP